MKRFVFFILAICISVFAFAQTETINWYIGDTTYATTTCQTGGDIILPTAPTKYGYTFNGWFGYTPIEYLEFNNDGQKLYAPLSIISAYYLHVKLGVALTRSSFMDIYGSNSSAFGNDGRFFIYTAASGFTYYTNTTQIGRKYDIEYIITTQGVELNVDGNKVTQNTNTQISNVTTIAIGTSVNKRFYGKIYYYQLFDENNKLLIHLIPVLDSNGTPCMYDKVEKKFYYNQGTGQFIAGPVLTE